MSSPLFCCASIEPYRPQRLDHELKFTQFLTWAACPREASIEPGLASLDDKWTRDTPPFAVQLVKQINFGALESKRYFVPDHQVAFIEVPEEKLIDANFQKLNTYKNYRCERHDKFFEVNIYQKDPINRHHWRATLARPADEIDLKTQSTAREAVPAPTSSTVPLTSLPDASFSSSPGRWAGGAAMRFVYDDDEEGFGVGHNEPMKDFTACDKECGYCGECDY